MRTLLDREGLIREVEVDSAGTHAYHVGEPPDPRSQKVAASRGYDLSGLRARRVATADFFRYDLILAMDRSNLAILQEACPPEEQHRLKLLLEYAPTAANDEVPDPYYGGPAGFEHVLDLIEDACAGVIEEIRRRK